MIRRIWDAWELARVQASPLSRPTNKAGWSVRLYDMTPRQIREAIEQAKANGDARRAAQLTEQLATLERIASSFSAGGTHE